LSFSDRPSSRLLQLFILVLLVGGVLLVIQQQHRVEQGKRVIHARVMTAALGLSDLALSTEARYTRHPVASDRVVMVMDHPGGIDRFPSTSFWAPPH
jgi:hypothetical protein